MTDRYAVAAIKNGQVHLTPLTTILQLRPDLAFLDKAEQASRARAQRLLDIDGGKLLKHCMNNKIHMSTVSNQTHTYMMSLHTCVWPTVAIMMMTWLRCM